MEKFLRDETIKSNYLKKIVKQNCTSICLMILNKNVKIRDEWVILHNRLFNQGNQLCGRMMIIDNNHNNKNNDDDNDDDDNDDKDNDDD